MIKKHWLEYLDTLYLSEYLHSTKPVWIVRGWSRNSERGKSAWSVMGKLWRYVMVWTITFLQCQLWSLQVWKTWGSVPPWMPLPGSAPRCEICSKGIVYARRSCRLQNFFFFDLPTKKIKIEILGFFFRSTNRPWKKGLEKIQEAKNQLCLA